MDASRELVVETSMRIWRNAFGIWLDALEICPNCKRNEKGEVEVVCEFHAHQKVKLDAYSKQILNVERGK